VYIYSRVSLVTTTSQLLYCSVLAYTCTRASIKGHIIAQRQLMT